MKKFVSGLALGLFFAATAANATGYMMGWTVTINGNEICSDPYIWNSVREIECD